MGLATEREKKKGTETCILCLFSRRASCLSLTHKLSSNCSILFSLLSNRSQAMVIIPVTMTGFTHGQEPDRYSTPRKKSNDLLCSASYSFPRRFGLQSLYLERITQKTITFLPKVHNYTDSVKADIIRIVFILLLQSAPHYNWQI